MKKLIICASLLLFPLSMYGEDIEKLVRYNFPVWESITDLDGSGLYTKLLNLVYTSAGYQVVREPNGDIPWKKSIRNVVSGRSDTVGGEYARLIKDRGLIHPRNPILMTKIYAVYRKKDFPQGVTPNALRGKRVVENLGFQLAAILGFTEIVLLQSPNEHSAAQMLLRNRADLILYEEYHYVSAREKNKDLTKVSINAIVYHTLPMFLMFQDTARGRRLSFAWDEGLSALHNADRLDEVTTLYKKYGIEYGIPNFSLYLK